MNAMQKLVARRNAARRNGKKGFTLVELIIVIAILAALVAILAPQYTKYVEKSRVAADVSTAEDLLSATRVAIADGSYTIAAGDGVVMNTTNTTVTGDGLKTALKAATGKDFATANATVKVTAKNAASKQSYTISVVAGTDGTLSANGDW